MQLKQDTQVTLRQAPPFFAENTYTLQPGETLAIASRISKQNATPVRP